MSINKPQIYYNQNTQLILFVFIYSSISAIMEASQSNIEESQPLRGSTHEVSLGALKMETNQKLEEPSTLPSHINNLNGESTQEQSKAKIGKQKNLSKKKKGQSIRQTNHEKKINFIVNSQQHKIEIANASTSITKEYQGIQSRVSKKILENENQQKLKPSQEQRQSKQIQDFRQRPDLIKSNQSSPLKKSSNDITLHDDQFDKSSRKTKETFRSSISSCQDYLENVFNYYCKLSYPLGKNPTFQQINNKVKRMQLTNFMRFCKDFKIRESIQRKEIIEVFKNKSSFQKYLTCDQFHSVVCQLGHKMFFNFQQDRRFGKMLVFLQLHNSYSFVRKMNELGVMLRMRNKRGVDVRSSPKYQYKLTPYNGKYQQQIQIEVKQRFLSRKQEKQEQVQWHKKNRLNKIDELYRNGVKRKIQLDKKQSSRLESNVSQLINQNTSPNYSYLNKSRTKQGCYNPSPILAPLKGNSYTILNQLRKKVILNHKSQRIYGPNLFSHRSKDYKLSEVIQKARKMAYNQNGYQAKQVGIIKKQVLSQAYRENSSYVIQKGEQKDYDIQQKHLLSEIQAISSGSGNYQTSKQFLRATAKVRKQNKYQMNKLQDLIGVYEKQKDKYLQKHLENQKIYEEKLASEEFAGGG